MNTMLRSPGKVVDMAHAVGVSVEGELGAWVHWNRAWVKRKTVMAPKASCLMINC